MTSPPPNVFNSGGSANFPSDEAAVNADSQSPVTAADLPVSPDAIPALYPCGESEPLVILASPSGESCSQEEISLFELCIRGFDEAKFLFDIGCVPEDFEKYMALVDQLIEDDEPPLFLQRTG